MRNAPNTPADLQAIIQMLQQDKTLGDLSAPQSGNKGPLPFDPAAFDQFVAQFASPAKQEVFSQYDAKRPGSSMLGVNFDYANQIAPPAGGAKADPAYDMAKTILDSTYGAASGKPSAGGQSWLRGISGGASPAIPRAKSGPVRVSPGIYRNAGGGLMRSTTKPVPQQGKK